MVHQTFKPGDIIAIQACDYIYTNDDGSTKMVHYPAAKYILTDTTRFDHGGVFLVNLKTGEQASRKIECADKNAITINEMNATHGIKGLRWEKV